MNKHWLLSLALITCLVWLFTPVQAEPSHAALNQASGDSEQHQLREAFRALVLRVVRLSILLEEDSVSEALRLVQQHTQGPRLGMALGISHEPPGVLLVHVQAGSKADAAKLLPGDVIITVNNRPLDMPGDPRPALIQALRSHRGPDPVRLDVVRDGRVEVREITLPRPGH